MNQGIRRGRRGCVDVFYFLVFDGEFGAEFFGVVDRFIFGVIII